MFICHCVCTGVNKVCRKQIRRMGYLLLQDVDSYTMTESRKEMEVATVRLENIKLKNKLKKKELQLKSKVQRHCGRTTTTFIY